LSVRRQLSCQSNRRAAAAAGGLPPVDILVEGRTLELLSDLVRLTGALPARENEAIRADDLEPALAELLAEGRLEAELADLAREVGREVATAAWAVRLTSAAAWSRARSAVGEEEKEEEEEEKEEARGVQISVEDFEV
jgi:hypothetical protein